MTISEAMYVISLPIAMIFVISVYYVYVKAQLFRLARYEYWADRFYAAAKPLVAHSETPDSVVSLIESLNDLITNKSAPMGIYQVYEKKLLSKQEETKSKSSASPKFQDFFKKYPEMLGRAETVTHAGMLAACYVSLVGSSNARAVLADVFSEMQLQNSEIGDANDVLAANSSRKGSGLVPLIMRH